MFNILKKLTKKESNEDIKEQENIGEVSEVLAEEPDSIPDDNVEKYEEAYEYIENKIDNFDESKPAPKPAEPKNDYEEAYEYIENKIDNYNRDRVKENEILYYYNKRQQESPPKPSVQEKTDSAEEPVLNEPKTEVHIHTEEELVQIEEAFDYFEQKADKHEKEVQQVQIVEELFPQIDEPVEEVSEEVNEEIKEELIPQTEEIVEEVTQEEVIEELFPQIDETAEETNEEEIKEIIEEIRQEEMLEEIVPQIDEPMEEVSEEEIKEELIAQTEEIIEEIQPEQPKGNLFGISFSGLKEVVSKTSDFFNTNIFSMSEEKQEIDDDFLDEMEEKLIRADIGINTTVHIVEGLREKKKQVKPENLKQYLKNEFIQIIKSPGCNDINLQEGQLNTILITGVNGAGKTTLIGKLAYRYRMQGKKVLVAAGDTFRAAAEDQLEVWSCRAGVEIIRQDGADPAAVVFNSIKKAKENNFDVLLIDTAGRLHNKFNLMEELRKIKKVIDKEAPGTLAESLLVLDATTGQNGLRQAEVFKEAVDITGVGLTKLDGTAKGGVVLGIAQELSLPVKLIGVGEQMDDLKDFSPEDFVEALF